MKHRPLLLATATLLLAVTASADQQILDDLIVDGSACVGVDCNNGESFGFDTIRIKENNVRIKFQDTSNSASFPTVDWELMANDSSNGGDNHFSIRNVDRNRVPFRVDADAVDGAIRATKNGVGLGTKSPALDLHISGDDTPTVRVEQTAAGGWTPQTWDVGGNEQSFFVRDATGQQTPLRVHAGAPSNSLVVSSSRRVGVGTSSPAGTLHLASTEDASTVMQSSGLTPWVEAVRPDPDGAEGDSRWELGLQQDDPIATLTEDGIFSVNGSVLSSSSRAVKHGFTSVDDNDVLDRVSKLDVTRWRYNNDRTGAEHLGPMAEDFHAAFGLGPDPAHIAATDIASVAVVSVKALQQKVKDQQAEIARLKAESDAREARLARLEALLGDR